jgi:D-alanyl-D-alanine carboxypeptidase
MQRINEVISRIQTIQARVERPPVAGAFQSLLNARLDEAPSQDTTDEASDAPADKGQVAMDSVAVPLYSLTRHGGVTMGTMLGRPAGLAGIGGVGGVSGVGGVGIYPPSHRVPAGSVMTSSQLNDYLRANQIEQRNGRLEPQELTPVSGSWHGNGSLLPPAAQSWELMRSAAAADGINLQAIDTYRTWGSQERAYQAHLRGEKTANVLPPGKSRHGAGLAVDITTGTIVDRNDREWQWLESNARSFGWHPISNETWHWEFRGV